MLKAHRGTDEKNGLRFISHAKLLRVLHYHPELGEFTVKESIYGLRAGERAGTPVSYGYVRISIEGVKYPAHRLAWFYVHGRWPKEQIDHINGVRDDNRVCNLREASSMENQWNAKRAINNSSGFKGVYFDKRFGVFVARITAHGTSYSLGKFETAAEAGAAYAKAAKFYHGEFARTE